MSNEATLDFPNSVAFRLEVADGNEIAAATLVYNLAQFACLDVPGRVPVEVAGSVLEWEWVMSRSGNPPPGAELWWEWELTTTGGETITTPRQTLPIVDDRFDWQSVTEAGIRVNWYEGEEVGPTLLEAAVSGLQTLEQDLGIELQSDAQFYIYGTSQDMRDAVLYVQDWAGGVAFPEYNVILMGVPPPIADSWGRSTVRHELAHLVVGQFGRSCVGGQRPTWLEEGLAMYVEGPPSQQTQDDLEAGTRADSFAPLRSLNGAFPAHDSNASMAYSQSYSVIDFLVNAYGQPPLQELILALADGADYDAALEQVYGFNVDGLETAWRASLGLPPRQIPPTPTPLTAASVPTLVPQSLPRVLPTPPAAAEPPPAVPTSDASRGLCGLGLIPLFLLVGWSRRQRLGIEN